MFAQRQVRLVLPGDGDVAYVALGERGERAARAGVEHRHVPVQLAHELPGAVLDCRRADVSAHAQAAR